MSGKNILTIWLSLLTVYAAMGGGRSATVSQISNNSLFQGKKLTGSITGGTRLYIKGSGFDESASKNEVFVGIYPCLVDYYYSTESLLVCEMPAGFYREHKDQKITVRVRGKLVDCRADHCTMDLELKYTPMLHSINPQAVFAGDQVNIHGAWRADNVADLKSVHISRRNCLLTETQLEEDRLSYSGYAIMRCQVPEDMEIGDHKLTITSTKGTGFDHPLRDSFGFKVGFEKEKYNLRVHPKIDRLSANTGFLNGQLVEIQGSGFGSKIEDVKVRLEDVECRVLELEQVTETDQNDKGELTERTFDRILCEMGAVTAPFTNKVFKGGAGFRNQVYRGYNRWLGGMLGTVQRELAYDKTLLSLENSYRWTYVVQKIWGVFRSREKGTYTFKMAGDDQCQLLLSKEPIDYSKPFDETTMLEIHCRINGWTYWRDWHMEPTQICDVELEADTDYYMVALQTNGKGDEHLTIAMITPNSDTSLPNQKPQVQKVEIDNTPVRHQIRIKIMNAVEGTFSLTFMERNANSGKIEYIKETSQMGHDVAADTLAEKIRQKVGTASTCVRETLDAGGNVVTDLTQAKGFRWTVSFTAHRGRPLVPMVNKDKLVGEKVEVTAEEVTAQSDPVEGNFKLRYADCVTSKIFFDDTRWAVRDRLKECDLLAAGVTVYTLGNNSDGKQWYIAMDAVTGKGYDLQVEENNLRGGAGDKPPEVKVTPDFEPAEPGLVYLPIPSEFLRTVSATPQLTVTVGDLLAGCDLENCDYSFLAKDDTPTVTSFALSGTTLTITMGEVTAPERVQNSQSQERLL